MIKENEISIAVIGLGYVGFPLAVELSKLYQVCGFDLNIERIDELKKGIDRTNEINHGLDQTNQRTPGWVWRNKKEDKCRVRAVRKIP